MIRFAMVLTVLCLCAGTSFGYEWQDLAKYKYGEGNAADEADKFLQKTPVAEHGAIEDALIALVSSKDATQDGKACACRMLQQIGTEKCVSAVAELLNDEVLSHYARLVLERMGSPKGDEAMRTALGTAPEKAKVGILGSLGVRRDDKAAQQIAALAVHTDQAVAAAAISALGRIGGNAAAECLSKLKPAENLQSIHLTALLDCARSLKGPEAVALYDLVLAAKTSHRIAALSGMLAADEKKAVALIVDFIKGDDVKMCGGALTLVCGEKSENLTKAAAEVLGALADEKKSALITALGARGDKAASSSIAGCLTSTNEGVRNAAIAALSKMGDEGTVEVLLGMPGGGADAIAKMSAGGVNDALLKALENPKLKVPAIKALVARNCFACVPKLLDLVADGDAEVRKASWSGLGSLATEAEVARMAKAAFEIKDEAELSCGVTAVRDVCARAGDKAKCFEVLATHYDATTDAAKSSLIDLASLVGSPAALDVVKKAMKSGNKELYGKAVRSLAAWCNESAATDLLELAKGAPDEVERILSLRGYIRIAGADNVGLNEGQRAEMFKKAVAMVTRVDEKKMVAAVLRKAPNADTLALVNTYLDDPALRGDAEQSALEIVERLRKDGPAEVVKDVANKLLTSKTKGIPDRAKKVLAGIGK